MKHQLRVSGPFWFLPPTLTVVLLTSVVSACRPDLSVPGSEPLTAADPPQFLVQIEPDAPLDATPRVLRAHVQWPNPIDKERVFLIRGEVTDYHLRQIERDDLTKTLIERIVPAIAWAEDERNVVIAPTVALEPGQTYAVVSGEPSKVVHFVVRKEKEPLFLNRSWPPADTPGPFGIFCGPNPLPEVQLQAQLDPLGPRGTWRRGIVEHGPGLGCLRFQIEEAGEDSGGVLPPVLEIPGFGVLPIEPGTFQQPFDVVSQFLPLECDSGEVAFGAGCAIVMDDRIAVRAPEHDLLWGISGEGSDSIQKTAKKERFVLKGFTPETDVALEVVTVDRFGRTQRKSFAAKTTSLSAHVTVNEVLANPIGPEPHQEWVELYNDGQIEAHLGGYRLLDIGGDTVLPDVPLPAGRFAVVVSEKFVEDGEVDVPPPPDVILVRVPALGKSGLSNSGELLRLVDPEGRTISRFPAAPKPRAGQSVSRRTVDAPDGVSSSFVITEPTPGSWNIVVADP